MNYKTKETTEYFEKYLNMVRATKHKNLNKEQLLTVLAIGLGEEAGEVQGVLKKQLFYGVKENKNKLLEELSDLLWYYIALIDVLDINIIDLMQYNYKKVTDRYPNGFNNLHHTIEGD